MTACVWLALYLLGLPGAFLLGVQAGVSNFVPYLGPILAAIPVGLVAMPLGPSMLIWAVGIYTVIQSIEGYVIGPLIQRRAVELPPAWTLVAIVLFGSLFGVLGIALAMPLLAIGRVAVLRLYVEDWLEDDLNVERRTQRGRACSMPVGNAAMNPVIDPRGGDVEDDASSTKRRSLLSLAGSLLAEISLPEADPCPGQCCSSFRLAARTDAACCLCLGKPGLAQNHITAPWNLACVASCDCARHWIVSAYDRCFAWPRAVSGL